MGRPHVVLRPELVGSPRVTLAGVPEPTNTLPRCETRALQVRGGALCKYRNGNVSATAVEIARPRVQRESRLTVEFDPGPVDDGGS